MFDYVSKIGELSARQFCCSQILMSLALEVKGCDNPFISRELIKAMSGLCGGMGGSGKDCGALTGGACVIGMFCGSGEIGEEPCYNLNEMVSDLVEWFESEYGSVECSVITKGEPEKYKNLCQNIMQCTFEKAVQLMLENGVEIN